MNGFAAVDDRIAGASPAARVLPSTCSAASAARCRPRGTRRPRSGRRTSQFAPAIQSSSPPRQPRPAPVGRPGHPKLSEPALPSPPVGTTSTAASGRRGSRAVDRTRPPPSSRPASGSRPTRRAARPNRPADAPTHAQHPSGTPCHGPNSPRTDSHHSLPTPPGQLRCGSARTRSPRSGMDRGRRPRLRRSRAAARPARSGGVGARARPPPLRESGRSAWRPAAPGVRGSRFAGSSWKRRPSSATWRGAALFGKGQRRTSPARPPAGFRPRPAGRAPLQGRSKSSATVTSRWCAVTR